MKNKAPKPPIVSLDLWKKLYEQAVCYRSLEPWKQINEDQVFAFEDPLSGELGYCCILGRSQQFFGLSIYRGREGVEMYFQLKKKTLDPKGIDVLHMHDALVMEFVQNKKNLDKEDVNVMKSLGISLTDHPNPPCFRSYLPGFKGWFLTEEEVRFLTLGIECANHHFTHSLATFSHLTLDQMVCPLYTPKCKKNNISWSVQDHQIGPIAKKNYPPVVVDKRKMDTLKDIKLCHDGAWEVSILNTSNVLSDHIRPYLAKICMIVHQETSLILHIKPLTLHCKIEDFISEELLLAVKKHKRLPGEILFNSPALYESLRPLTKALGIQSSLVDFLPATAPAQENLLQYMQ